MYAVRLMRLTLQLAIFAYDHTDAAGGQAAFDRRDVARTIGRFALSLVIAARLQNDNTRSRRNDVVEPP